mgnify:FL=1
MEGRWNHITSKPVAPRPTPPPRALRRPWSVEETPGSFEVKDREGFLIVRVYWRAEPALHQHYFSWDEARRVALNIAKLPDLVLAEKARQSGGQQQPAAPKPPGPR